MGYPYQGITPDEYQRQALRTEHTPGFVMPPPPITPEHARTLARLLHGAIGICTEAGELQDMIKKHLIYGKEFDPTNVIEECGDLLWYIAIVLNATGYTMSDCMERNIAKLLVRFPEKFTEAQAQVRDLPAERSALEVKSGTFHAADLMRQECTEFTCASCERRMVTEPRTKAPHCTECGRFMIPVSQ